VATEYTLPTLVSLPSHTPTLVIRITPTLTLPAVAINVAPPTATPEPPRAVILDTPTPERLSRALANVTAGSPPPIDVLATLPGGRVVAALPSIAAPPTDAPTPMPQPAALTPLPIVPLPPAPTQVALLLPGDVPISAARADTSDLDAMRRMLRGVPILAGFDTPQVRAIAARGREIGARLDVFTVVGDSNSVSGDFLRPLVLENYCTWGAFSSLQAAVRHYSASPDGTARSSFSRQSITTQMGFNSAAARDPFRANNPRCNRGESPLTCEMRVTQPAAAIIMLGGKDVGRMSIDTWRGNMSALVDEIIAAGAVPVLTTFVVLPERDVYPASLAFNAVLVEIAAERGTPLINLWAAAETLPDHGIAADRTHLRTQPGRFCDFDGGERIYGGTLRNLLTLGALDLLRQLF
jgi:hypothetical protein